VRTLDECTNEEIAILALMNSLAAQLPGDLVEYTRAIGEINRRYFHQAGKKRGVHNPSPGSVALTRSVRATQPWR
jgi:hypothetical protein